MVTTQRLGEAWQARAACRGPQAAVFFPPTHAERKEDKRPVRRVRRRSARPARSRGRAWSMRSGSGSRTAYGAA